MAKEIEKTDGERLVELITKLKNSTRPTLPVYPHDQSNPPIAEKIDKELAFLQENYKGVYIEYLQNDAGYIFHFTTPPIDMSEYVTDTLIIDPFEVSVKTSSEPFYRVYTKSTNPEVEISRAHPQVYHDGRLCTGDKAQRLTDKCLYEGRFVELVDVIMAVFRNYWRGHVFFDIKELFGYTCVDCGVKRKTPTGTHNCGACAETICDDCKTNILYSDAQNPTDYRAKYCSKCLDKHSAGIGKCETCHQHYFYDSTKSKDCYYCRRKK